MQGQTLSHSDTEQTPAPQIPVPSSLCILRLSAIGDVCHAVAMVQSIQRRYPEIKITWVIGKIELSLVKDLPGIEFVVFDKRLGLRAFSALRKALSGRRFDVLFNMQVALRAGIASTCIRAKTKVGFDRARSKEGHGFFTQKQIQAQRHPHVIEGFQAFAQTIGVPIESPQWDMPIDDKIEQWWHEAYALESRDLESKGPESKGPESKDSQPYIVISPAASKAERNWHAQGYAAIAEYAATKGFNIVLCGGPSAMERTLADEIHQKANVGLIDIVGKTSLLQLLHVLKGAVFVLAPDTGPAHMAVTVGTPVVGLYAHSNPRRTGPYLYQDCVASVYDEMIEQQYGKAWDALPWGVRAKGEDLMASISVDLVKAKVDGVLATFFKA